MKLLDYVQKLRVLQGLRTALLHCTERSSVLCVFYKCMDLFHAFFKYADKVLMDTYRLCHVCI